MWITNRFTMKSIRIYKSVQQCSWNKCICTHRCTQSKYEIMLHIFALDFFLCFSYVECHNFLLFSMIEYENAQKQCINKFKVNNVYNLYLTYTAVQYRYIGIPWVFFPWIFICYSWPIFDVSTNAMASSPFVTV